MKNAILVLTIFIFGYLRAYGLEIQHIGTFSFEEMGIKDSSGNSWFLADDIIVSGTTGYLVMYYNAFLILDLVDIDHPKGISFLPLPGYYQKLNQMSDSIIAGYGSGGVIFIDVSTVNTPSILSTIQTRSRVNDVELVGNMAYIADASDGLLVADITSITSAIIVSTYKEYGSANGLESVGKILYVDFSGIINQMAVFDISSGIPVWQNSIQGGVGSILRSNSKNYLVSNMIKIFNIANPLIPELLTTIFPEYGLRVSGLMVDDKYIYASGSGAVQDTNDQDVFLIYGMSGDSNEIMAEWVRNGTNWFSGLFVENNIVYVADGLNGLTILRIEEESDVQDSHWCLYQ